MNLAHWFYVQDLNAVVVEMAAVFVFWTVLMLCLRGRLKRAVCIGAAVASLAVIFALTVVKRSSGEHGLILIPFYSFVEAQAQPEMYRSMLMNVCLFLPLGLSLPLALPGKIRHRVLVTILCALVVSVLVEGVQLVLSLGRCETDDVIMNVLGAAIGSLSFLICKKVNTFRTKHIHRHIEK